MPLKYMRKITLLRKTTQTDIKLSAVRMDLEIITAEEVVKDLFVKQRLIDVNGKINDVFAAVASPVQIEDLDTLAPAGGTSYFRDSKVSLMSTNIMALTELFNTITSELQTLVDELALLESTSGDMLYSITADNIETQMGTITTHYRIPLKARPSISQETFTDPTDGIDKVRIANTDLSKPGWIGTVDYGCKFTYNIAADTSLSSLWPIPAQFLAYAHLEVGGVTKQDVIINQDGVFWKNNILEFAPFPLTAVNWGDAVASENDITLVLDFIK